MTFLVLTTLATIIGFVVMLVLVLAFLGVLVTIFGPWPLILLVLVTAIVFIPKPRRAAQSKR